MSSGTALLVCLLRRGFMFLMFSPLLDTPHHDLIHYHPSDRTVPPGRSTTEHSTRMAMLWLKRKQQQSSACAIDLFHNFQASSPPAATNSVEK